MSRPLVLVVEDDFDVRESITDILEHDGYDVRCAGDGREALDLLDAGPTPALILLDLMMAGMNGFQFRAEQRRRPELAAIPVVILSADRQIENKAHELGADGFLRKPTKMSELLAVLHRLCPA